jgi:thiol-disulfide isomerase/thioredoxin
MNADFLRQKHQFALPFDAYVSRGAAHQRESWRASHDRVLLTGEQAALVSSFRRQMNVIVLSGLWCGDCAQQCPLLARIAEPNPLLDVRFLERDEHGDLQDKVTINGGRRVPVVVFCAEDFQLVSWYGDRTLSRYRAVAALKLGAACPLPGAPVPSDELAATLQDWLNEFERAHWILRLSPRLRDKHGD